MKIGHATAGSKLDRLGQLPQAILGVLGKFFVVVNVEVLLAKGEDRTV